MGFNLHNRSFLKEIDFEPHELRYLLQLSESLKLAKYAGTEARRLNGKEIALIFEKTSTRTRSAFEVAAYDQGAHVTYLNPSKSQLGHKESIADTAAVLGLGAGVLGHLERLGQLQQEAQFARLEVDLLEKAAVLQVERHGMLPVRVRTRGLVATDRSCNGRRRGPCQARIPRS